MAKTVVMAVDDEADNLALLTRALPQFNVRGFTDPRQAVESVAMLEPRALLLDFRMPHLNGVQVLEKCRSLGVKAPCLMVTAFPAEDPVREALDKGELYQLVEKPFNPADLNGLLECALIEATQEFERLRESLTGK